MTGRLTYESEKILERKPDWKRWKDILSNVFLALLIPMLLFLRFYFAYRKDPNTTIVDTLFSMSFLDWAFLVVPFLIIVGSMVAISRMNASSKRESENAEGVYAPRTFVFDNDGLGVTIEDETHTWPWDELGKCEIRNGFLVCYVKDISLLSFSVSREWFESEQQFDEVCEFVELSIRHA